MSSAGMPKLIGGLSNALSLNSGSNGAMYPSASSTPYHFICFDSKQVH